MQCDYCYCGQKYEKRISASVIDKIYSLVAMSDVRSITFFGGEPLLELELLLQLHQTLLSIKPDLRFCLTTNGLLLTPKIYQLLLNKNIDITLSIDGNQARHDKHRKLHDGSGTWDLIMKNVMLLKPIPRVRLTFSPKDVHGLAHDVKTLHENEFCKLGFYPISGIGWSIETLEQYTQEYQMIVDFCIS
jgi:uncharacterized protein